MGRTANSKELNSAPDGFDDERLAQAGRATQELARMNAETTDNAHALATQLGYAGILTVGAVEDEIRMYQGRAAEASFEMGKRLLILKEMTPHGEFQQRVDLMGINYDFANRIMKIARKFSKVETSRLLKAANTQSKLLELLVLDDDEIEELEAGETVRNLHVDKIETMSVRELKAALRAKDEAIADKERLIVAKDAKLNELDAKLNRKAIPVHAASGSNFPYPSDENAGNPAEEAKELREELHQQARGIEVEIRGPLKEAINALLKHGKANEQDYENFVVGFVCQLEDAIAGLRSRFMLKTEPDDDDRPDWDNPAKIEEANKRTAADIAKSGLKI